MIAPAFRMTTRPRLAALAAALLYGLAACDVADTPAAPASPAQASASPSHHGGHGGGHGAAADHEIDRTVWRRLAELRYATVRFHDIARAEKAGFAPITGCMEDPTLGGMGFHYGDLSRFDAELDHTNPEILVYAPVGRGSKKLKIVAVEWAVPYTVRPADGPAPVLMGIPLHRNDVFGLWVLHAWVWQANPAGMFQDWNPNIRC